MPFDVILLGHGSHRTSATDLGLREIHRRLQERFAEEARVSLAFFEFLHPSLAETVANLAESGTRRAILMPYFLFEGREIQRDIPDELAHLREQHPTLDVTMAANLGIHPNLIAVATDRACQALRDAERASDHGGNGRVGVVLVNRGVRRQYDDGSRLNELCRLLRDELSGPLGAQTLVEPALAENSPQTVEAAAASLIAQGAQRIVVLPYLHFPGKVLLESVVPATERARAAHPGTPHMLAQTLGVDDRIVAVCEERVRAALAAFAP